MRRISSMNENIDRNQKYARAWKDDNGEAHHQILEDHSHAVAELASEFATGFGGSDLARVLGRYHDLGKGTPDFQAYLFDETAKRGSVQHSIIGAKSVYDALAEYPALAEFMANCIAAHHGRLYDFIAPRGDTPLANKLAHIDLASNLSLNVDVLLAELKTLLNSAPDKMFARSMLVKLLFSCLVDADRLDAYLCESQQTYAAFKEQEEAQPDWVTLLSTLENYLSSFTVDSDMARLRRSISDQCAESGLRDRGIYKLQAPTGGGKTLSSLRFALVHAQKHKLDRIIYVIPYLSILSQTANSIRDALGVGDEIVLEHHSNVLPDRPEYYKLHTGRWDKPIILTTQVQFLESVFSARGSDLRKLHSMANSVIIFDEVQSLPVKCVHLFNSVVNFLNKVCRSTVLLCTATQPLLDTVDRKLLLSDNASIADYDEIPQRTRIVDALTSAGYTYSDLAQFVQEKHETSTLVIVNTKAAAKSLFSILKDKGLPVLHLSTNMCSAHRDAVFAELQRKLDVGEPIICVSTQLIEAGVDISFECVIRDVAGLDSVCQAAGRCNRHGELGTIKEVYVINIAKEKLDKLPDIKKGAEITRRLFNERRSDDIDAYYQRYFFMRQNIMDYPTEDEGSIYDLLSSNEQGYGAYCNKSNSQQVELRPAIRSAAEAFYVIDRGRDDVVVPYGEATVLLNEYAATENVIKKSQLLKRLGRYSVSLYKFQREALEEKGALSDQDGIMVIESGFYDSEFGVNAEGIHELLCV